MIRIVHLIVVCAFVTAAIHVYKIKYDATVQAQRVAVLRAEIKRDRDIIASLRAQWAKLDSPDRIQALAQRHLKLKPIETSQYEALDRLPDRPTPIVPPDSEDPIAVIIENVDGTSGEVTTGSIPDSVGAARE
jgi:hypothetical protein